jgi:hypothetical protein
MMKIRELYLNNALPEGNWITFLDPSKPIEVKVLMGEATVIIPITVDYYEKEQIDERENEPNKT